MTDSQNQGQPPQGNSGGDGNSGENPEESFWKKFDERIDAAIDRKVADYRKKAGTGTSRTGRTTLPGILADLVFGPASKD